MMAASREKLCESINTTIKSHIESDTVRYVQQIVTKLRKAFLSRNIAQEHRIKKLILSESSNFIGTLARFVVCCHMDLKRLCQDNSNSAFKRLDFKRKLDSVTKTAANYLLSEGNLGAFDGFIKSTKKQIFSLMPSCHGTTDCVTSDEEPGNSPLDVQVVIYLQQCAFSQLAKNLGKKDVESPEYLLLYKASSLLVLKHLTDSLQRNLPHFRPITLQAGDNDLCDIIIDLLDLTITQDRLDEIKAALDNYPVGDIATQKLPSALRKVFDNQAYAMALKGDRKKIGYEFSRMFPAACQQPPDVTRSLAQWLEINLGQDMPGKNDTVQTGPVMPQDVGSGSAAPGPSIAPPPVLPPTVPASACFSKHSNNNGPVTNPLTTHAAVPSADGHKATIPSANKPKSPSVNVKSVNQVVTKAGPSCEMNDVSLDESVDERLVIDLGQQDREETACSAVSEKLQTQGRPTAETTETTYRSACVTGSDVHNPPADTLAVGYSKDTLSSVPSVTTSAPQIDKLPDIDKDRSSLNTSPGAGHKRGHAQTDSQVPSMSTNPPAPTTNNSGETVAKRLKESCTTPEQNSTSSNFERLNDLFEKSREALKSMSEEEVKEFFAKRWGVPAEKIPSLPRIRERLLQVNNANRASSTLPTVVTTPPARPLIPPNSVPGPGAGKGSQAPARRGRGKPRRADHTPSPSLQPMQALEPRISNLVRSREAGAPQGRGYYPLPQPHHGPQQHLPPPGVPSGPPTHGVAGRPQIQQAGVNNCYPDISQQMASRNAHYNPATGHQRAASVQERARSAQNNHNTGYSMQQMYQQQQAINTQQQAQSNNQHYPVMGHSNNSNMMHRQQNSAMGPSGWQLMSSPECAQRYNTGHGQYPGRGTGPQGQQPRIPPQYPGYTGQPNSTEARQQYPTKQPQQQFPQAPEHGHPSQCQLPAGSPQHYRQHDGQMNQRANNFQYNQYNQMMNAYNQRSMNDPVFREMMGYASNQCKQRPDGNNWHHLSLPNEQHRRATQRIDNSMMSPPLAQCLPGQQHWGSNMQRQRQHNITVPGPQGMQYMPGSQGQYGSSPPEQGMQYPGWRGQAGAASGLGTPHHSPPSQVNQQSYHPEVPPGHRNPPPPYPGHHTAAVQPRPVSQIRPTTQQNPAVPNPMSPIQQLPAAPIPMPASQRTPTLPGTQPAVNHHLPPSPAQDTAQQELIDEQLDLFDQDLVDQLYSELQANDEIVTSQEPVPKPTTPNIQEPITNSHLNNNTEERSEAHESETPHEEENTAVGNDDVMVIWDELDISPGSEEASPATKNLRTSTPHPEPATRPPAESTHSAEASHSLAETKDSLSPWLEHADCKVDTKEIKPIVIAPISPAAPPVELSESMEEGDCMNLFLNQNIKPVFNITEPDTKVFRI